MSNGGVSSVFLRCARPRTHAPFRAQLILYWYGTPHPATGLNLATCIWQSRGHAVKANSRPHHIRAMRLAAAAYEFYDLERWRLQQIKGERGLRVERYEGGEVGW